MGWLSQEEAGKEKAELGEGGGTLEDAEDRAGSARHG